MESKIYFGLIFVFVPSKLPHYTLLIFKNSERIKVEKGNLLSRKLSTYKKAVTSTANDAM